MDTVSSLLAWGAFFAVAGALLVVLFARKVINDALRKYEPHFAPEGDVPNVPKHPRWPREDH